MGKSLTTEDFIKKARQVWEDKYDYLKVVYKHSKEKVCIICPEHGEFWQIPNSHLSGYGCPKCANNIQYTTKEWVEKAKQKFPQFDYSKVDYKGATKKVIITCSTHGDVIVTPNSFINSTYGCPKCGREMQFTPSKLTTEQFVQRGKEIHSDKYDYSQVNYINNATPVNIICPIHGSFLQVPNTHLQGSGCPKCANEQRGDKCRKTTEQFVREAAIIHNNYYDYSLVNYTGKDNKVTIICLKHGEFYQTPHNHLGGQGCPKCKRSKGEMIIEQYLIKHNLKYETQKICFLDQITRKTNKIVLDFLVIYNNRFYVIEYNGEQHYKYIPYFHKSLEEYNLQKRRDYILRRRCNIKGYPLIEIPYYFTEQEIIIYLDNIFSGGTSTIYTDGAYSSKYSSGGWSFVEVVNSILLVEQSGKRNDTTNNRMEIEAVLRALKHCLNQCISKCVIYTDSKYVEGCINNHWTRKKNTDLWEIFDKLNKCIINRGYSISVKWIKGHQKDDSEFTKWNNHVDKLANKASNLL